MFTGIIEEKGKIAGFPSSGKLQIRASRVLEGTKTGDSISVSGVCLTVAELPGDGFVADVMPETLSRSTLGAMQPGAYVNLERALEAGGRLGGHIVNGHIDGTGRVTERRSIDNAVLFGIEAPVGLCRYTVEKGSVAIDGISLTIVEARDTWFSVSIIPHTLGETTLGDARPGTGVNIEVDIIAKYVERLLSEEGHDLKHALERSGFMTTGDGTYTEGV